MRRSLTRLLVLPLAGAAAGIGVAAAPANAATGIVSGTGTFTVPASFLEQAAGAGVFATPQGAASASYDSTTRTATVVFTATGGNAQVKTYSGTVDYSGGITFADCATNKSVALTTLTFHLLTSQVDATAPDGSVHPLFDTVGPVVTSVSGTTQTYTASGLKVDPAGAAYLDSQLGTTFFTAGQSVGGFGTSYSY